jgi:hypothetical protein
MSVLNTYANNKGAFISFEHVLGGEEVKFKAAIQSFKDSYKSEWNNQAVFGRMDPIATYKRTGRIISCELEIMAGSYLESVMNHLGCSTLARMQYGLLQKKTDTNPAIIAGSPLIRIKMMNWIQNAITGGGLLGYMAGFEFNPDVSVGVYEGDAGDIYAKKISLSFGFTILHEQSLGYDDDSEPDWPWDGLEGVGTFPYKVTVEDEIKAFKAARAASDERSLGATTPQTIPAPSTAGQRFGKMRKEAATALAQSADFRSLNPLDKQLVVEASMNRSDIKSWEISGIIPGSLTAAANPPAETAQKAAAKHKILNPRDLKE